MKFLLGKKIGMTQVWKEDIVVPVTKIKVGPCVVTDIKSEKRDSYNAVQIGFGEKKEKNVNKPQKKEFKDLKFYPRYVRELRVEEVGENVKKGNIVDIDSFEVGDKIDATGWSKGRGFQGVVRRHGFAGMPKSHGTKDQLRMPGSAGAMGPARIFKGKKMPGRMGNDRTTTKNLEIIEIDSENDILFVKGGVAGANSGLILLRGEGKLKFKKEEDKKQEEVKQSDKNENNKDKGKEKRSEIEEEKKEKKEDNEK
ncbi:50S ribosomal protein L3 [bacterium]|nr:50S ribosomal protein L3 [bacterium]